MPKTLAEIALSEKLVAKDRLVAAQAHCQVSGEPLVVALVELEQVNEAALVQALARHLELALVDLAGEPDLEALRQVSYDTARGRRIVPLAVDNGDAGRVLRVAMADPTDADTLAELEGSTGCKIEPVLSSLAAVDEALPRMYGSLVTKVMRPEPGATPPHTRIPFGGNLMTHTPSAPPMPGTRTEPYHNLEEEAPIELRFKALLAVLADGGVVAIDRYHEELRRLLKERG